MKDVVEVRNENEKLKTRHGTDEGKGMIIGKKPVYLKRMKMLNHGQPNSKRMTDEKTIEKVWERVESGMIVNRSDIRK